MENGMMLGVQPGQRVSNAMIDALVAREVARIRAEDAARQAERDAEAAREMKAWQEETMRLAAKEGRMYETMSDSAARKYRQPEKTRRQRLGEWCLGWWGWIALGLQALLRAAEWLGLIEWVGDEA